MSVRIAILGASGAVGSTLALHILRAGLLEPQDALMLVGHGTRSIERRLMPLRVDLLDAFDDERVQIEICPDIDDFEADIVVVATGATRSSEHVTRRDLAQVNLPIFRRIAQECVARLPRALFIVVSNPVELAVQVLTEVVVRLDASSASRSSSCASNDIAQVGPVQWGGSLGADQAIFCLFVFR
jgi:malate dehydrogenase